jgi:hypothetical protein
MSELEFPQKVRGGAGYFPEAGKVIIEGYYGATIELTEGGLSNGGNGDPPVVPLGTRIKFDPLWELGGNVDTNPNIGSGQKKGEVVAIPLEDGRIGCRMHIDLVSARQPTPTNPGSASGSYEFYLPDSFAALLPNVPVLDGDGNITEHDFVRGSGSVTFWIAGSGVKHFVGGCKWTFREWRSGGPANPRPKVILIVDGDEWKPTHPKTLYGADWNMALTIDWAK